jgi:hypothetical protein
LILSHRECEYTITIRKTKARGSHPIIRQVMETRTAIKKTIFLTRLAICVAKQVTVSKSVLKYPPKMTTIHLSQSKAQKKDLPLRKEETVFSTEDPNQRRLRPVR